MTTQTQYITAPDTAKLIRKALKQAFPAIKFSVRTSQYAGGASIDVRWTDGPSDKAVQAVAGAFAGASFDGMIDLKSYHKSDLDGQAVHFGADFVFTHRDLSDGFLARVIKAIANHCHAEPITVAAFRSGLLDVSPLGNWTQEPHWNWSTMIRRAAEDRTTIQ